MSAKQSDSDVYYKIRMGDVEGDQGEEVITVHNRYGELVAEVCPKDIVINRKTERAYDLRKFTEKNYDVSITLGEGLSCLTYFAGENRGNNYDDSDDDSDDDSEDSNTLNFNVYSG